MSSTGRGATRRPNDDYQTPPRAIDALLHHVRPFGRVLEPCRGSGNIYRALENCRPRVTLLDWCELAEGRDFFDLEAPPRFYDWIVTNPPFSLAQEFIDRSLLLATNVVMLLRLNFLESEVRREWWQTRLPTAIYVLSQRPGFLDAAGNRIGGANGKGGTDSCAYGWFVWSTLYSGIHVIGSPPLKK